MREVFDHVDGHYERFEFSSSGTHLCSITRLDSKRGHGLSIRANVAALDPVDKYWTRGQAIDIGRVGQSGGDIVIVVHRVTESKRMTLHAKIGW